MLGIVIVQRARPHALCHVWRTVLALVAITACSSSSPSSGTSSGTGETATQPRLCSKDTIRYHAYLATGSCNDVQGSGGTWIAESAFPDAPPEIRDAACTYAWTPPQGTSAKEDVAALEALTPEVLTKGKTFTVTEPCAPPALGPSSASLIPPNDVGAPPTGVSGCDVCGRIAMRRVYVILPPDKTKLKTYVIGTQGGSFVSFKIDAPDDTQVFSVELPESGASYVQGRINMVEAPF